MSEAKEWLDRISNLHANNDRQKLTCGDFDRLLRIANAAITEAENLRRSNEYAAANQLEGK